MVQWAGPNSRKGKSSKGKGIKTVTVSGGCGEESFVKPEFPQRVTYERKRLSYNHGRYSKKPPVNARPTMHFVKPKAIVEPDAKHTLQHIVRIRWDENTINTNGSNREAFYDGFIEKFQEYYKYPDGYEIPQKDRIVRAHLKKYFKQYLGAEKRRLIKHPRELMKSGCTEYEIDVEVLKPHYFSQRAWNSICEYWGIIQFETSRDRAAGKVRKVRSKLTLEEEFTNEPPSPCTQKELYRKKDLIATMQARPPNRGRIFLRPQNTVGELLGAREIAQ
ncbi:hypothetical protein POM88_020542 [Heracleum sosnowskyi]|uniref:Uncharacterized protein n=1 Tax=Heracleum sosnowskyi TaxID=360622 RepID=A0AAD8IBL8_9APIA|nr:hypothetical protein POM88_020542 [Heracleum sosnowskyi]